MKRLVGVLLAALLSTSPAAAQKTRAAGTATLTGTVQDCWDGRIQPVHGLQIYAYDLARYPQLQKSLERLGRLQRDLDRVGGEGRFFQEYDHLDRLVRDARGRVPRTRTRRDGGYQLRGLAAGRSYLLLAIDLEARDNPYFQHVVTDRLKPGTHQYDLWISPEAAAECRPLLTGD